MDPTPISVTDELLAQVRDELRTLNQHMAGGAERGSGELREPAKKPAAKRAASARRARAKKPAK